MKKTFRYLFYTAAAIVATFFCVKTAVLLGFLNLSQSIRTLEYLMMLGFIPIFFIIVREFFHKDEEKIKIGQKIRRLNTVLVRQSHNTLFYDGNISDGAKEVCREVAITINADRCSVWLYNRDKSSIVCIQLYKKLDGLFENNLELKRKDFPNYFSTLEEDPIIIADNAEKHPATSCFTESYLRPLGIKSMLDVPIIYRGETIGVICIESFTPRSWLMEEVNFAELLSSLFAFAYSVKEVNELIRLMKEKEKFVDSATLVSKTDVKGNIIYVNKRFVEVSGWTQEELIGKNHRLVNSGQHPKEFWTEMYDKTINKKEIWNKTVTNKSKSGEFYWVDSHIKGDFDEKGVLIGFSSIRYDVTDVVKSAIEIENKNVYLEHAAKILRHDMHSGINTYIPRGISSLERRLDPETIQKLKLEAPLRMIKEGLIHTQKVYSGVYEFTNLVKPDSVLQKKPYNLAQILIDYLANTSYSSQVAIDHLPTIEVNQALFCTAIDNLIRNGLRYNDSESKMVAIYMADDHHIAIQDNGRGMSQEDFEHLSRPYTRKEGQKESGSGLGLNICVAILKEHGFSISCEKLELGTKIKIGIR